jgi:hypothetical protein
MCFNGIQLIKIWIPIQPIHILVDCSSSMFAIKIISLKNESPSLLHKHVILTIFFNKNSPRMIGIKKITMLI